MGINQNTLMALADKVKEKNNERIGKKHKHGYYYRMVYEN